MILFLMIFLTGFVKADAPHHWSLLSEVRDRHEFYADNEMIVKPKDSWQTLFSVVYTDIDLNQMKDCVFYRVPGADTGVLKIKTVTALDHCDKHMMSLGDKEWTSIRSLQFASTANALTLNMTFPQYRSEKWHLTIQNKFQKPKPKMHASSVDAKSARMIFLAPKKEGSVKATPSALKANTLCHDINEDCEEVKPSICSQCSEGWYEIPNGCNMGPKYCGRQECGLKNQPACRRGMEWQKTDEPFECRVNSTFAYCTKGLEVHCEGKLAYCR